MSTKTVSPPASPDALRIKKSEDVAKMQASLLACTDNPEDIISSMKTVTVLRVMHQISRIVTYLDMMDRVEEKLYSAIDAQIESMDIEDTNAVNRLLTIQGRLQDNMIKSHQLLQPYLNVQEFDMMDIAVETADSNPEVQIMSRESRDRLRTSAENILMLLDSNRGE